MISHSNIQFTIWNTEDKNLQSKAQDAREEMQDVVMVDDVGDLAVMVDNVGDLASDRAGCIPPSRPTRTLKQTGGSNALPVSTSSPERLFASHVTSPYRLLMQPFADQHADMVPSHDNQQETQMIEIYEDSESTLFPTDLASMASPWTSPWQDYSPCADAIQFSQMPIIGAPSTAHNISSVTVPLPVAIYTSWTGLGVIFLNSCAEHVLIEICVCLLLVFFASAMVICDMLTCNGFSSENYRAKI